MVDRDQASGDEARFIQLVAMFQMAAMQQLGKIANPVTDTVERDLEQARATIDMVETLERKTAGNRTDAESGFLEKVLFELRMNFVDETRQAEGNDVQSEDEGPGEPDPAGDAGEDGPTAGPGHETP